MGNFLKKVASSDFVVLLSLSLFGLLVWLPTRYFPYFGDAEAFINQAANFLVSHQFHPLIAIGSDFAHPPLVPLLISLTKIDPKSTTQGAHLIMLPFILLYLYSSYFLIKKFTNPLFGLCGAFILSFIPVFLVEAGNLYIDLPVASLALSALSLFIYKRILGAAILMILAVFTKETALLYLPFFYLYPAPSVSKKKKLFFIGSIFLGYTLWLIYHYLVTGWLLFSPQSRVHDRYLQSIIELLNTISKIFRITFIEQARILILIPFFLAVLIFFKNFSKFSTNLKLQLYSLMGTMVSILIFYLIATEYLARYALIAFPLIITFNFTVGHYFLKAKFLGWQISALLISYTLVTCLIFSQYWYPKLELLTTYDFRPQTDLGYQDVIRVFTQAAGYISNQHPQSTLVGTYPENFYFTDPTAGYLAKPLPFIECYKYSPGDISKTLVIIHPLSPGQLQCRKLLELFPNHQIASFQSGSKWLEIYSLSGTVSAKLNRKNMAFASF